MEMATSVTMTDEQATVTLLALREYASILREAHGLLSAPECASMTRERAELLRRVDSLEIVREMIEGAIPATTGDDA
jgi:hypothetical protein